MKRTFALAAPIQFSIGLPDVTIAIWQIDPRTDATDRIVVTQEALGGGAWGDEQILDTTRQNLSARYPGDEIVVMTVPEWEAYEIEKVRAETTVLPANPPLE